MLKNDCISIFRFLVGLSWFDMKSRYARTKIGNIWPSLVMLLTVALLSYIYSYSFGVTKFTTFVYIISGFPLWMLLSNTISEAAQAYKISSTYIRNIPLPLYIWIIRVIFRNVITYFHNILLLLIIFMYVSEINIFNFLLFQFLAFFLVILIVLPIAVVVGTVCLFYESFTSIVGTSITFLLFASPIFIGIDGIKKIPFMEFNPIALILNFAHRGVDIYDSGISFLPYAIFFTMSSLISVILYNKTKKIIPLML
jgi:lipopolysaccharide transport system permease protein